MLGEYKRFVSRAQNKNSSMIVTHGFVHRQTLVAKTVGEELSKVLEDTVNMKEGYPSFTTLLKDESWCFKPAYLADILKKLNDLSLYMKGHQGLSESLMKTSHILSTIGRESDHSWVNVGDGGNQKVTTQAAHHSNLALVALGQLTYPTGRTLPSSCSTVHEPVEAVRLPEDIVHPQSGSELDYRTLYAFLFDLGIQHCSYELGWKRLVRAVVNGLLTSTKLDQIKGASGDGFLH
uniref:Uncharacterized protein n=1 Tax=Timema poppense TaxID=170557 RepID=A0A7R9DQ94_TIMPO|nr:unnamed protein product [Timema poppensis]